MGVDLGEKDAGFSHVNFISSPAVGSLVADLGDHTQHPRSSAPKAWPLAYCPE